MVLIRIIWQLTVRRFAGAREFPATRNCHNPLIHHRPPPQSSVALDEDNALQAESNHIEVLKLSQSKQPGRYWDEELT